MIDESQLMEFSSRFRDIRQLEREYLLVLLLHEIYAKIPDGLVFKGGTALKYFYNLNRFSEDADFSFVPNSRIPNREMLTALISAALHSFGTQYKIVEMERRANKKDGDIVGLNYEIRVAGPLNQKSGQLQNIKIDISLRKDLLLKPEPKYLNPVYQDISTFAVTVMDINEILAEKLAAMIERTKMRDIYDSYYLLSIKKIRYDEKMLKNKMWKRGEIFKKEDLSKKLELANDRMKWRSELAYIVDPLPGNKEVVSSLKELLGL